MELLRLQRKGSEESEGLPWAEQGLLSRPSSHWEVCSGTCHHPRCVFAVGAGFMGSSPPLLLGRFKIPQTELDLQQSQN